MQIKLFLKRILYPLLNILDNKGLLKLLMHHSVVLGLSRIKGCRFSVSGNGSRIIIGDGCVIKGLNCLLFGDDSQVIIGNNVHINASKHFPTVMNAVNGTKIIIGDECLFSNSIELHTTDYHPIYEIGDGKAINNAKDIVLDSHVWVGFRTIILKGSHISSDSVIGAGSLVASSFEEKNIIVCGIPAKIIKSGINWHL